MHEPSAAQPGNFTQRLAPNHRSTEATLRIDRLPRSHIIGDRERSGTMSSNAELAGQTVLVIGGSSGIGLETARLARAEGAGVIITARETDRLHRVGLLLGASIAAFDATDVDRLASFFRELPRSIDHVLLSGPGSCFAARGDLGVEAAFRDVSAHLSLALHVARSAKSALRPRGTLLLVGATAARHTARSYSPMLALGAVIQDLALELAPIRVNLIATGLVETPLVAADLGDQLAARRERLRAALPIGRLVTPADVAALAVHLMTNGAVTGATFDIDGGQRLVEA